MKPDWPLIDPTKLGDNFESWRNGLAYPVQKALLRLRAMTQAGLTIEDNMASAIVTLGTPTTPKSPAVGVVHGVEFPFKSPTFRPRGFMVLEGYDTTGAPALPVVGNPVINYNRSDKKDGWYGLTVNFAPPFGGVRMRQTVAQSLAAGAVGTMSFDTIETVFGKISATATRITCLAAGMIDISGIWSLAATTPGERSSWIQRTSNPQIRIAAFNGAAVSGAGAVYSSNLSAKAWRVAVGDTFDMQFYYNGPAGPINTSPGTDEPYMNAHYVAPPVGYSAILTGILWGG